MPVVAILSLRMRVIFDYVVESGHLFLVVLQLLFSKSHFEGYNEPNNSMVVYTTTPNQLAIAMDMCMCKFV